MSRLIRIDAVCKFSFLSPALIVLGIEYFLDGVSRHSIEEENQKCCKQCDYQEFENHPLVVVPQNIAQRLQRVQEPHE